MRPFRVVALHAGGLGDVLEGPEDVEILGEEVRSQPQKRRIQDRGRRREDSEIGSSGQVSHKEPRNNHRACD